MRTKSMTLLTAIALFLSGDVLAEPRTQADLRIDSIRASVTGKGFSCAVEIFSHHDDWARDASLKVLLPVGVRVALMPDSCTASAPTGDGTVGFVSCDLGSIPVGGKVAQTVVTTIPPAGVRRSCGALVWSKTPDPDPTNNQAATTAPQPATATSPN